MNASHSARLTDDDFARLLEFRDGLRRFLRWSEARANEVGLTAALSAAHLAELSRLRPQLAGLWSHLPGVDD